MNVLEILSNISTIPEIGFVVCSITLIGTFMFLLGGHSGRGNSESLSHIQVIGLIIFFISLPVTLFCTVSPFIVVLCVFLFIRLIWLKTR